MPASVTCLYEIEYILTLDIFNFIFHLSIVDCMAVSNMNNFLGAISFLLLNLLLIFNLNVENL